MKTNFLETERLIVQAPIPQDIDDWVRLMMEWRGDLYSPKTIQEQLERDIAHYQKHGFGVGSVYEKESGTFIGTAGLIHFDYHDDHPDIEIGYALLQAYWGNGYATELARAILIWGFSHLSVNKLIATARLEDKTSQHVLQKVGMRYKKTEKMRGRDILFYEIEK